MRAPPTHFLRFLLRVFFSFLRQEGPSSKCAARAEKTLACPFIFKDNFAIQPAETKTNPKSCAHRKMCRVHAARRSTGFMGVPCRLFVPSRSSFDSAAQNRWRSGDQQEPIYTARPGRDKALPPNKHLGKGKCARASAH